MLPFPDVEGNTLFLGRRSGLAVPACPQTCNSVEPGIYLSEFGIRSEVDVYIDEKEARVTGAVQNEILPLLA